MPGKVLVLRHGTTDRMKLGVKFADIVQRIERNPTTGKFDILYSYEDGRTLRAVGQVGADGIFAELLTAADGSPQRNLYLLDTPRKMRIMRQRRAGDGWANASFATKVGETPRERVARETEDRRQREALAAAERARVERERARREAEEEARWAEEEAEREAEEAESAAQRQRSWQMFQNDMQDIVRRQQADIEDSRRFRERIEADVARQQEMRRQREEDARRAANPPQRAPSPGIVVAPHQRVPVTPAPRPVTPTSPPVQRQPVPVVSQPTYTPPVTKPPPVNDNPMVSWREAVVLCEPPKSGSGEWSCHGPLQTTYGHPDKPSGAIAVRQACGGGTIRELGQSGGFRTYGCGFGTNPANAPSRDPSNRFGVFVPGRSTFTCPKKQTTVCTNRN